MTPKIHRFFERFKSPEDWLWDLICTRQGSNLQPYDPKSYPTELASSKVETNQGLPDKITLELRGPQSTRLSKGDNRQRIA
jgi:hypothetical protein